MNHYEVIFRFLNRSDQQGHDMTVHVRTYAESEAEAGALAMRDATFHIDVDALVFVAIEVIPEEQHDEAAG